MPTVIGVCGLPCCGKTFILERLQPQLPRELLIIDCDRLAKDILTRESAAVMEIMGTTDLKKIADIIFSDEEKYNKFTAFIWKRLTSDIEETIATTEFETVILDAPLLLESNLDSICDTVIVFDTKQSVRDSRASARGWDKSELDRRDAKFLNLKKRYLSGLSPLS